VFAITPVSRPCWQVEPLQREVEQEQGMALTEALGWKVTVEYLDRSPGDINHHSFLPDAKMQLISSPPAG